MEKNKAGELRKCFALLDAEYGDKLTEQQRIYKKELFKKLIGNKPIKVIKSMVYQIIRTRKYNSFPKIAEMIEIMEGNREEETQMAWIYLLEKIEEEGYYMSVRFPKYPAITGVIEAWGGWPKFCEEITNDQEKWIKKEFIQIYPLIKKAGSYPEYNPGYFEITNTGKGYENDKMIEFLGMTIDGRKAKRKKLIAQKEVKPMKEN